ncbi:MAG TPA: fumarylacetoacetate hydrolase family protein [Anaerolineaceae bacterium]|nr:fumarylacetoacetate hydrolase family protein [Anaerolineaceae bacterium]
MRFIRYQRVAENPRYGWVLDEKVGPIEGDLFGEYRRLEADIAIDKVRLLAPVNPSKIICVGRNYAEHAREHDAEVPDLPLLFLKPPSAVIGPGGKIVVPPQSENVEHEAELAVVIGKTGRWIATERALDYVFGYTIGIDVTARDLQRRDGQWTRGKSFDTFCPLGPWIETELDPADTLITCRVNEEMRQMASTREMVFTVAQLVAFSSTVMTLFPGDVIMTGTPAGVGPIKPGDVVEATIEGIGILRNPVIAEERR